jgi:TPR repeat protein
MQAPDLSNLQKNFHDVLGALTKMYEDPDADPAAIAEKRLEVIKTAQNYIANKSSARALGWYGFCLVTGQEGFPVQFDRGVKLMNEAILGKDADSVINMADILSGQVAGVTEDKLDYEKALKLYERAGEQFNDGYACYRIATMLLGGSPLPLDVRKGLNYVERSQHLGDDSGTHLLAWLTYNGEYLQQDSQKAYDLISDIIARTDGTNFHSTAQVSAIFLKGLMMYDGAIEGTPQEAYDLIKLAGDYGDGEAIRWLDAYHLQNF